MKKTFKVEQFEKHLRQNWRCPVCFCRYLKLTHYLEDNKWNAECTNCGCEIPEECNSKHTALNAWYDLVDEAEAAELALTLKT